MPEADADHLWRGEDAYPTLYLDDVSDFPFSRLFTPDWPG